MVSVKRCQVVPFTHTWVRHEPDDWWSKQCVTCGKFVLVESKGWYVADRTDIPKVIPAKQPPKSWSKLPTRADVEAARAIARSLVA